MAAPPVMVFDASGKFLKAWGGAGADDQLLKFTPDGKLVLQIGRSNQSTGAFKRMWGAQALTLDGRFVKQLVKADTPFARHIALSPDREQQFLYVGNSDDIVIVDRKRLEIVGVVKPPGMRNAGHQIATDSKGNLYLAQTTAGLQKLTFRGMTPAGK